MTGAKTPTVQAATGRIRLRSMWTVALALILGVLAAGCGIGSGSNSAASVDGRDISMSAYHTQLAFRRVEASQSYGFDVCSKKETDVLCRGVKMAALDDLIQQDIIDQYAQSHGIRVTNAQFRRAWAVAFKQSFHNSNRYLALYSKVIGVRPGDVKARVRQDILRSGVMLRVIPNVSPVAPATLLSRIVVANQGQLAGVQRALKAGTAFNQIAYQLDTAKGTLCHRQSCGLTGWLPNPLVPPQQKQVITAQPGTVIGPFVSQQSITLLQVVQHRARNPLTSAQIATLRQQRFSVWLAGRVRQAHIQKNVQV